MSTTLTLSIWVLTLLALVLGGLWQGPSFVFSFLLSFAVSHAVVRALFAGRGIEPTDVGAGVRDQN